jgi:hypothetical protein
MKPPKNNVKKTPKTQIKKLIFLFNFQEKKKTTPTQKRKYETLKNPEEKTAKTNGDHAIGE